MTRGVATADYCIVRGPGPSLPQPQAMGAGTTLNQQWSLSELRLSTVSRNLYQAQAKVSPVYLDP